MNNSISKLIPEFSDKKNKQLCEDNVYIGIDFGTSTTIVSCCYWDGESDRLKVEEMKLGKLNTNPPMKQKIS